MASRPLDGSTQERPLWRALIVEDLVDDAELVLLALKRAGVTLEHRRIDTEREFLDELNGARRWDIILCDYDVPGFGAPRALQIIRDLQVDIPLIVMSGQVDEEQAVTVLRNGAQDFVAKARLTRLAPALNRAIIEADQRRKARKELEEARDALVRNEKLRTLGYMAAGIAHDLRNILNPLSLQVQLLQRGETNGERQKSIADNMSRTLKRGTELLNRLQAFSRQGPENVEVCDLRIEVEQACALLKANVRQAKGVVFETEIADVGLVRAVPSEVVSATVNLVTNAIEALSDRAGKLRLTTRVEGGFATLMVEDNGPGMPSEVKARLFEPFFTTKANGTGLGLAGIYAFVQRCQGRIDVATEHDRGTRITLSFTRVGASQPDAGEGT
jgi:signal transduction histidine kinase